ncbi:MAG TPA: oxidoreductase [Verrucomicrobia bacterium]|nr:oxidoreductase [Verrucomicrobiota bacterium]
MNNASGSISRRRFLKGMSGAIAMPFIIPGSALGLNGRPSPSNRLTMAGIGLGNMGSGDLRTFLSGKDVQVVAVCDVRKGVRDSQGDHVENHYAQQQESGTYKGCDRYSDFREVLARDDIDAVHVATPDHWHAIIANWAMKRGKDVYCQKPLTLTIREAWTLVETARRYGRVLQTGSQQRSSHEFWLACSLVRNGRIGEVKQVNVNVGGPSFPKLFAEEPIPEGFDWDMWLGPAPKMPYNAERCSGSYSGGWRLVRDYSGGMMTDWGAHHFDITQWGLGMDGSGPVKIEPPNINEDGLLTYTYENGTKVVHQGGGNGVLFIGTEGEIEVNRGHFRADPVSVGDENFAASETPLYRSDNHYRDFLECVKSRQRPICDVEVGASSVTMCHLGNIAWWLGRTLQWDPNTRQMVGDEEASRWVDRPKRAPWYL